MSINQKQAWSNKWLAIKQITRMDKPIGTYLLLWPTFWALWIAADGFPNLHLILVFSLGVFIMRSAGCVINDFADRKVDGKVKRTAHRPLVSGAMTSEQALSLFAFLIGGAIALVLTLSLYTIYLSMIALLLAASYPFMKRYTQLPQVVLGAAFSWGMIMAFAELQGEIPVVAWLLFFANVLWTVAYDTMYAMVDRDDDLKIGVKSTAILFGKHDKRIVGFLQLMTLALLFTVGDILAFGWPFQLTLVLSAGLFCYQQMLIVNRDRDNCFKAFLNNHWVGLIIFVGVYIEYL
ncbi:4-hydroxybenzoate octaprenyltransferase [Thalassotalea castellviae]|uniref:4-hydroxybenzoate octaprenyltransferase n=1 Tax=Thalassotalea castellviae TaxID=3075612 RepID=A0ABU3A2H4_9GAMM|nr:4-hydroxybenzoate octaprenyltransferase [Thalassotalea sp. W431]MDT0604140.1 4-hydroxybenzoate octaprenyltransferase [Thalassotalea sp. W431]